MKLCSALLLVYYPTHNLFNPLISAFLAIDEEVSFKTTQKRKRGTTHTHRCGYSENEKKERSGQSGQKRRNREREKRAEDEETEKGRTEQQ